MNRLGQLVLGKLEKRACPCGHPALLRNGRYVRHRRPADNRHCEFNGGTPADAAQGITPAARRLERHERRAAERLLRRGRP